MLKIFNSHAFITIIILVLNNFSCKESQKNAEGIMVKQSDHDTAGKFSIEELTKNQNQKNKILFLEKFQEKGYIAIIAGPKRKTHNYFYSDTLNYIVANYYDAENNNIKLKKSDTLKTTEWTYLKIDSTTLKKQKINGEDYFYFSTQESFMGQAIVEQSASFNLYNLKNGKLHELSFAGVPRNGEDLDGIILPNKSLNQFPKIKNFHEKQIEKSRYIYYPKGKEKDINYYKNYDKKWEEDNGTYNSLANGHNDIPEKIYFTYYAENLFKIWENDSNERIENNHYTVVSEFRGNILVYDKMKKKYFPLFVESCITGCHKSIQFIENHVLEVNFVESSQSPKVEVDLRKVIFKN